MVYSVMSSKVEVRNSPIHGKGMFAKTNIEKGEVVFIKGGYILSKDELYSSGAINSYLPLDDNYFLAARNKEEELHIKLYNIFLFTFNTFINASCSTLETLIPACSAS